MKVTLLGDKSVRVEASAGHMEIVSDSHDLEFSPYHMLAGGLAYCTWSLLAVWGKKAGISIEGLSVEVQWAFAEKPYRVGRMDLQFKWPLLPARRRKAAEYAASLCPIHHTLMHPPKITIEAVP